MFPFPGVQQLDNGEGRECDCPYAGSVPLLPGHGFSLDSLRISLRRHALLSSFSQTEKVPHRSHMAECPENRECTSPVFGSFLQ